MSSTIKWTPEHDAILLRALVASALASRRGIYTTPGLEDVSGNGGSRINQRLQLMLRKLCASYGAPSGVVEEEVARSSGKTTPKNKAGIKVKEEGGKKRKRETEDDEVFF